MQINKTVYWDSTNDFVCALAFGVNIRFDLTSKRSFLINEGAEDATVLVNKNNEEQAAICVLSPNSGTQSAYLDPYPVNDIGYINTIRNITINQGNYSFACDYRNFCDNTGCGMYNWFLLGLQERPDKNEKENAI